MLTLALLVCSVQDPDVVRREASASEAAAWFSREQAAACAAAAERGLTWLAARQLDSGAWVGYVGHKQNDDYMLLGNALQPEDQRAQGRGHLGVTALCGMAFLASGSLPDRGPYATTVARTVDYVVLADGTVDPEAIVADCTHELFIEPAQRAVARWTYTPAIADGAAVARTPLTSMLTFSLAE